MSTFNLGTARGKIEIDSSDLNSAGSNLQSAGRGLVGFGAAAVGAFAYTVKVAADFEKEMDYVRAITQGTEEDMAKLGDEAIRLGKRGPFGPREIALGFVDLAKAGIDAEQIVAGVGQAAVDLAASADIPLTEATEVLVNTLKTFNIEASESIAVVDMIAGAANASTIDVNDFAYSLRYAGSVAAALDVPLSDVSTALAILGDRGIKGSTGGTSLRRVLLELASPSKKATGELKKLGLVLEDGSSQFFDATGALKPLPEVFQLIKEATKDLNQQELVSFMDTLFGARAAPSALILMEQGIEGFEAYEEAIGRTTASDVAEERLDNLAGAFTKLKAAIDSVLIGAGSPFQDGLKEAVELVRDFVLFIGDLPPGLQKFIALTVVGVGALSLLAGGFLITIGTIARAVATFGQVGASIRIVAGAFKGLSLALAANPFVLIILAVVALGAALYHLYTTNEGFKKFIDELWQTIQRVWDDVLDFFRGLPAFFSGVWDDVTGIFQGALDFITGVPGQITDAFGGVFSGIGRVLSGDFGDTADADGFVTDFIRSMATGKTEDEGTRIENIAIGIRNGVIGAFTGIVEAIQGFPDFMRSLPGIVAGALGDMLSAFGRFASELPGRIGYAIGFIVGSYIRMVYELVQATISLGDRILKATIEWGGRLGVQMYSIGRSVVTTVIRFFATLPTVVRNFLVMVVTEVINWGIQMVNAAIDLAVRFGFAIYNFFAALPGRIASFMLQALDAVRGFISSFETAASEIGLSIVNGIMGFITGLPDLVGQVVTNAINMIRNGISGAFNAARDFGAGLWDGFKDGMGINSPSYIEKALMAVEGQSDHTKQYLSKNVTALGRVAEQIPDSSAVGLQYSPFMRATPAQASPSNQYNQNAPLIGQATIKDERDAYTLANELEKERNRRQRARGGN